MGTYGMNKVIDIDTDKITLIELVTGLKPDDEVVIVKDHKPVAKLVATSTVRQPDRKSTRLNSSHG